MKVSRVAILAGVALTTGLLTVPVAHAATEMFSAKLLGDNEVPPNNTPSTATFQMQIDTTTTTITFTLTFSGLSGAPSVAHLHFAPTNVVGNVMIFLCGGGGQPACPTATSGTISGTITTTNVVGPTT